MTTIQNVSRRVQALANNYIPKKLHPRFVTGVAALGTTALSSLNANGRGLSENRWTGESRIRRVVTDTRFPDLLLSAILKEFLPKRGQLRLSLDHSTFGVFTVAVFALSAGKGRALPVWCVVTRTGKGHPLLKPLLHGFRSLLDQLSYQQRKRVIVVMDRWFAIPELLEWLDGEHLGFVVRLKQNTPVGVPWVEPYKTIPVGEVSLPDTPVTYHGHDWRLVRSDLRPDMKSPEPWFLLTNIPPHKLTRQQVLRTYAKRFEIEEHFKDIKWIERYEWHQMKKLSVARTVFMFVFFGWWLLLKAYGTATNHPETRKTHPKKRLSWFRTIWEYWQRLRSQPLFRTS
jgi:DDE family transposase